MLIGRDGTVVKNVRGASADWLRMVLNSVELGLSPAHALPPGPRQRYCTTRTGHVVTPKMIEIPDGQSAPPTKLRPPPVFVLKSGERVEVRRYTILGGFLRLTVDGKQRTIPLTDLDLKASTAANRERGVNLRIHTNPNEIVMGF